MLLDLLAPPGTFTAVLTPWAVVFASAIFQVDPFYFIFDEILGDRYERTIKEITVVFCIRMITLVSGFELARILGNLGVVTIIVASIINRSLNLAKSGCLSSIKLLVIYRYLILCYSQIMDRVLLAFGALISMLFWFLVISWWIVVNQYEEAPLFIYCVIASFAVLLTLGFELVLFVAAKMGDDVYVLVNNIRYNTKMDYLTKCTLRKWRKILWFSAKATRPIRFPYASNIYIDQSFFLGTSRHFAERITDALLIIRE